MGLELKWVDRDEFMEWLCNLLSWVAYFVIITVNAMFAGMIIGCWWIGRQDLMAVLISLMFGGATIMKIIMFKEGREAKRARGEALNDGWKLPPPEEGQRKW